MDEELFHDLFASLPAITISRFFGGQGVYSAGAIVAVVIDGELYLRSDVETQPAFEEAGCLRWRYQRAGKAPVAMPYYRIPDDAFDDAVDMNRLAALAMQAVQRQAGKARGISSRRLR